ncbi:nitroreductase/quinone reductase family protein [Mycobacterium tuberculosis]
MPGAPPGLLLHTTGAKTGQPRTTSLTYARGGTFVVASKVASPLAGLVPQPRANPDVEINVRAQAIRCDSEAGAAHDPDYARLWRISSSGVAPTDAPSYQGAGRHGQSRTVDPPLNLGASARRAGKFAGPYSYFVCRSSGSVKRPTSAILAAPG